MSSKSLFERAKNVIPGGVNSPVRAFKSVGADPIFAERGEGAYLFDVDGNRYIDYIQSWGPMILGHAPELLMEGFESVLKKGTSYGVPTAMEVEMAELITGLIKPVEMIRMVNSGTEATMSALRLARGFTGRNKIVKFEGCYHGHSDALLVKSGSGTLTYGVPTSPGVPADVVKDTLVLDYNDIDQVSELFNREGDQIACVILEPVAGNMGVVAATQEFVEALRRLCTQHGALLIFDEVITGFRLGLTGAYGYFGVEADLTCYGKIIGGGLPVGAYGGKREVMNCVSPVGGVYQAGTLSGNPLAMYMGYKMLTHLKDHPEVYREIEAKAVILERGLSDIIQNSEYPLSVVRVNGMVCLFFTPEVPRNYKEVATCDTSMYGKFFREMLQRGILLPPAQFEGLFLSAAHSEEDVENTLEAVGESLKVCYNK
ncbi:MULTISPECIES: glutamate-1-semialdehyde 2,1-aminomutase [unclassified Fusibacter]|uniref:glutamate-1-semialdehyde 2,1-aminomutase n=1 Tax=unclassified Fusibacter TaxID=2624464 RepID=UPI001010433C|nr:MULTISPECIES: glutamate-1-semialdehyde 2,1-aminomutase [unclassified Fusibacter]MCK8060523.1 glutamate-1-semialdehyde 2,1-aminomutase [Fusibacter sp. A2]NPE20188.1 glutamate-1-semialdehyde 2,1-aminomutase [Fusibacter sp. A1]RXV63398.1 glutamate-1-semialdehyde-2,1-aminomutase [Fusibacter sp. A1]